MSFLTSIGQKAVFVLDNVFSKKGYIHVDVHERLSNNTGKTKFK